MAPKKFNVDNKKRRSLEKDHINEIRNYLPITKSYTKKISDIDVLHILCIYMKAQAYLKNNIVQNNFKTFQQLDKNLKNIKISPNFNGFIIVLTTNGDILHISENVNYFLQLTSDEILIANEKIFSVIAEEDLEKMKCILTNENNYDQVEPFIVNWNAKKRKSFHKENKLMKIEGYFTGQKNLFIASCTPIITPQNRNLLVASSVLCFTSVHLLDLKYKEMCKSGEILLAYNSNDIFYKLSLYDIVHSSNLEMLQKIHKNVLKNENQNGYLMKALILRADRTYVNCLMNIHFSPKGFIICNYQVFSSSEMKTLLDYFAKNEKNLPIQSRLYNGINEPNETNAYDSTSDDSSLYTESLSIENFDDSQLKTNTSSDDQMSNRYNSLKSCLSTNDENDRDPMKLFLESLTFDQSGTSSYISTAEEIINNELSSDDEPMDIIKMLQAEDIDSILDNFDGNFDI